MGALLVRLADGTDFAIGTGFSDRERENPTAVGATVTFRYQELSEAGVPRFPSWVGVRLDTVTKAPQASSPVSSEKPPAINLSSGAVSTKSHYFEFVQGASNKFWEVTRSENSMNTRWGRIGSKGQSKIKEYTDQQAAADAIAKLIKEKTDEGYVERPQ